VRVDWRVDECIRLDEVEALTSQFKAKVARRLVAVNRQLRLYPDHLLLRTLLMSVFASGGCLGVKVSND
jgi:trans-aconitate methyltransferase